MFELVFHLIDEQMIKSGPQTLHWAKPEVTITSLEKALIWLSASYILNKTRTIRWKEIQNQKMLIFLNKIRYY